MEITNSRQSDFLKKKTEETGEIRAALPEDFSLLLVSTQGDSQLPATPPLGYLTPFSGLYVQLHTYAHTLIDMHIIIFKVTTLIPQG